MTYAFDHAKRLLTKKEYEWVFTQSRKTGMKIEFYPFFVLTVLNDKNTARIGFALSKKCLPSACLRNRVKRVFREHFRIQAALLKKVDIVVLAKPGLAQLNNQEIIAYFDVLWQKINAG